jgi:DNA-binding MarR family transcriptional regulator
MSSAQHDRPRRFLTDRMRGIDATVTVRVHAEILKHHDGRLGIAHARLMAELGAGARPTELARRLGVTKAAVGQLLDVLEAQRLIERAPDESDRRAQVIRPTARARRLYRVGRAELDRIEAEWLSMLGRRRLAELDRALTQLDEWREKA